MKYEVKNLEEELLSDNVRKDPTRLSELLADDFFEFTQSGKQHTKSDIIEILPTLPKEIFTMENYVEKRLSEDAILVRYAVERFVPSTGEKKFTLCSSVWQKNGGVWQMSFFQGTPGKKETSD